MDLNNEAAWIALLGPGRDALGAQLQAAGAGAPLALRAAWLIEVERRPHEADRLLEREPLHDAGLRALLAAAAAQMYDDAPSALRHAETARRSYADPLRPLHGWAAALEGVALLELGWPARALPALHAALRIAHRDGMSWLQLDALRGLARAHDEAGEPDPRDVILESAEPLVAAAPWLPASDSLRRLKAQVIARQALLGGPWPTLKVDTRLSQRIVCAWLDWLQGKHTVHDEIQALRMQQRQQYWPLKWQVDLGQIEGALAATEDRVQPSAVLAADVPPGLSRLQAEVLDAGHARLKGRFVDTRALRSELHARGLRRLASRLALVRADDAEAVAAWWRQTGRDAVDAVWLAPRLLPLWPALLALPDARRSTADQQAMRLLGERLTAMHKLRLDRGACEPPAIPGGGTPAGLTPREWAVLQLIGQDWSNAQIAAKLFVAEVTVKTHINRIYAKLDLTNRQAAQRKARELSP